MKKLLIGLIALGSFSGFAAMSSGYIANQGETIHLVSSFQKASNWERYSKSFMAGCGPVDSMLDERAKKDLKRQCDAIGGVIQEKALVSRKSCLSVKTTTFCVRP